MSAPKHTPGPWKLIPHREDDRLTMVIGNDGTFHGRFVCNVATISPGHHEDQANARLIAAAPELLEAAVGALIRFRHYEQNLGGADGDVILELELAIAKATGGAE